MIVKSEGGTMFTGTGVNLFRMTLQLYALKFKRDTGMEMARDHAILPMVKKEYGLKGNVQSVYDQFLKIVMKAKASEVIRVPLYFKKEKDKALPMGKKPDFVYWPVESVDNGWKLGKVTPDQKGYVETYYFFKGGETGATNHCIAEAAARGISKDQAECVVGSSMFPTDYFHQLKCCTKGV